MNFRKIIQKLVSFIKSKLHDYENFTINLNVVNQKKVHGLYIAFDPAVVIKRMHLPLRFMALYNLNLQKKKTELMSHSIT